MKVNQSQKKLYRKWSVPFVFVGFLFATCHDANAAPPDTTYAATIVGLKCESTSGGAEVTLRCQPDQATAVTVRATNGVKNPGSGQIWKSNSNYFRYAQSFRAEVWKSNRKVGTVSISSQTADGRQNYSVASGSDRFTVVVVKDTLPEWHGGRARGRAANGKFYPPESFSFFGNVREPVAVVSPFGDLGTEGACTAWAITSALGTQMINMTQSLRAGEEGFDRHAFAKEGFNLLDPVWFYNQRGFSGPGWWANDALKKARDERMVIPFLRAPEYGVRIMAFETIVNDDNRARWILSVGDPLITSFDTTDEFSRHDFRHPFMGSVDMTKKGGHSVVVIGYNNPWRGKQLGVPYWEVQNSWGKQWGRDGYFFMKPQSVQQTQSDERIRDQFYHIKSAVICERSTGRILDHNVANVVLKSILDRPKATYHSANVLGVRNKFAENVDAIQASLANDPSLVNQVKIRLTTPSNITWWKGIKIFANGTLKKEIWNQDATSDQSYTMDVNFSDKYELEFMKAKAFGAHTAIKKHSFDLVEFQGKTLTFHWSKD